MVWILIAHPEMSYLSGGALEREEHVAHVSWYEHHGRQCHAPAHALSPSWKHVVVQGEGDHLDSAEEEHTLAGNKS